MYSVYHNLTKKTIAYKPKRDGIPSLLLILLHFRDLFNSLIAGREEFLVGPRLIFGL